MITMTNRYDCGTYDDDGGVFVCVGVGGGGGMRGVGRRVCVCVLLRIRERAHAYVCMVTCVCVCAACSCVQLRVMFENFFLQLMPHDRQMVLHLFCFLAILLAARHSALVLFPGYPACRPS